MIWNHRRGPVGVLRSFVFAALLLGVSSQLTSNSFAGLFTLVDDNSVALFDTDTQANAYNWTVDGVNQLVQQAFWYRIGNTAEQSLSTLSHTAESATDTDSDGDLDTLVVNYTNPAFKIQVRYTLLGGAFGSGTSDIAEQIRIDNLTNAPMDFHFFQYSDFNLNGTAGGDYAVFTNANAVDQYEGTMALSETVVTSVPSHREIATYPVTLAKLNDGLPTTLSDTPIGDVIGPGDVTWAYQWDKTIAPNDNFIISKDKWLDTVVVPEPASFVLLNTVAGLLLARRRSR